jgi:hypothetical protein
VRSDGPGPLDTLSTAVKAVGEQRTALLADLEAVGMAATALDQTDVVCLTGEGSAARASRRRAAPLASAATAALGRIRPEVASYRTALLALGDASVAVPGEARTALQAVVTAGQREATALEGFRGVAVSVWPSYRRLEGSEGLWITRAVTPWYRTAQEGSAAYTVLVEKDRDALNAARTQLGTATRAVGGPIDAQAASLTAADAALASVRAKG